MTPQDFIQGLQGATIGGLGDFEPKTLRRYVPKDQLEQVPAGFWVSIEDVSQKNIKASGQKDFVVAGFCCPNGHPCGTTDHVTKEGWVNGGTRCADCGWFAPILRLEDWKPSRTLQFKMLQEFAAKSTENALSREWAMAHARIVGDMIRGMHPVVFVLYTALIMVVTGGHLLWMKVAGAAKWFGRTLVGK